MRKRKTGEEEARVPEASFPALVLTLAAGVLQNLGLVENPLTKKSEKNIALAKRTIDMLSMLKEKTRGNLEREEEQLLNELLYDLKIKYVKAEGKVEGEPQEPEGEGPERPGSQSKEA